MKKKRNVKERQVVKKDRLFLFDFDGVIVDSLDFYEESSGLCFERMGFHAIATRDDFLDLFEDNFYVALVKMGLDVSEFDRVAKQIDYKVDFSMIVPFYEMTPVLEKLTRNNILVVVSSNSRKDIDQILSRYGFAHYFDDILSADFMRSKVDKILHAMKQWNIGKENTYFVGDTVGDIKEAREARVHTIAVTWGWHSKERLTRVAPDYLVETPKDFFNIENGLLRD